MTNLQNLSWNDLIALRAQVEERLTELAPTLVGTTVEVPAYLLEPTTPAERRTAKVTRINPRHTNGMFNVTIVPGGAYGSASVHFSHVKLVS